MASALLVLVSSCAAPRVPEDAAGLDAEVEVDADRGPPTRCPSAGTRVLGTVVAPNGVDPLPGALVYIVPDTLALPASARSVECGPCDTVPIEALASARSAADGTFRLRGPLLDDGGTFTLVTETGYFRHVERHVVVPACDAITLPTSATRLPAGSAGEDTIPRVAVASSGAGVLASAGNVNDDFARILDLVGVEFERFDPNRSGARVDHDMLSLLADPELLAGFHVLVVPCGALGAFSVAPHLTPDIVANLRAWIAAGGRLYASDLAYEVVARGDEGAILFASGPSHVAGADPANVGQGISSATTLDARIDDPALLAWLTVVGAVADGTDTIPVSDLRDPWAAMDRLAPEAERPDATGRVPGRSIVSAEVTWHTMATAVHPLTVRVDVPDDAGTYCGRVVFSSFHGQTSRGESLLPQERVLEYLFFELSGCVREP